MFTLIRSITRSAVFLAFNLIFVAPAAHAALLWDLTGGSAEPCGGCGGSGTTYGMEFSVSSSTTIDAMGVWDDFSGTFPASDEVGLWDSSGDLLASATITPSSTAVASTDTAGQWLMENITAVTLPAGDYYVGNVFGPTSPLARVSAGDSTTSGISLVGPTVGTAGGGLTDPTGSFDEFVFGPDLSTTAVSSTPEPSFIGLLGLGLAAIFVGRMKR